MPEPTPPSAGHGVSKPKSFCCPDDLKALGLAQDDDNHRVWSFANLEQLLGTLKYVLERITGENPINLTGFFLMNANPMMRGSEVRYRDILLEIVNAKHEGAKKDRVIITGTAEVAREIVSNPVLCDLMLMADGISPKPDVLAATDALATVRGEIADLKKRIKNPAAQLSGTALQRAIQDLRFELHSKVADEDRLFQQEEQDYEDRIDRYVEKCRGFLNNLYEVAGSRSVTVINVHAASQVPFFLFALQRAAGEPEPRSVVVQAFLDTRNLASVVDEGDTTKSIPLGSAAAGGSSGAFKLPGALSLDPTYNDLLLELTGKLARRFDEDNALLRPGQDRDVTLVTFAFAPTPGSDRSLYSFREWLFGAARRISLRRLRAGGPNQVAAEVIPLPLSNGLALAMLGGADESPEVRAARLVRAVTFAWRLLAEKASSADVLHQGFKLSASVHATSETLIWAPNGCVTIAGAALSIGIAPTRGREPVDGRLFLHDDGFSALSEEYGGLKSAFLEPASSSAGNPGEWWSTDISANFVVVAVFPVAAQAEATGPSVPGWFEDFCRPLERIADPRSARWYGPANLHAWALCLLPRPTAAAGTPEDGLIRQVLNAGLKLAGNLSESPEHAVKPFRVAIFRACEQFLPPHQGSRILGAAITRIVEHLRALPELDSDQDFLIVPKEWQELLGDSSTQFASVQGWLVQQHRDNLSPSVQGRAPMNLSGKQIGSFVDALSAAFVPLRFEQLLLRRLERRVHNISMKSDFPSILYDVVDTSNREGWALQLLDAARASNPNNPQLLAFEESLGLGVIPVANKVSLEKIVNERSSFQNVLDFRTRLGLLESWLCAFEIPKSGGTGLLVGPDLVLTNYHVIEGILTGKVSPANVRCRFDYKALSGGETVNAGTAVALANPWEVVSARYSQADIDPNIHAWGADELDFAIVRLSREIGREPIGDKAEPDAPERGWLALPREPAILTQDDVLFVLQHPQDLETAQTRLQPMKLAIGTVLSFTGNGLRMRHDTRTLPGSSGSPVFNADLDLVALHHAGEPNNRLDYRGAYNQAIPLGEIMRYLQDNGHDALLES